MPRKRQIDPDIWTSEQVIALSLAARLMFIGMISHADDDGLLKGSALSLKVSIFPADTYTLEEIKKWREEIVSNGLVVFYENGGSEYLCLPTFRKYQYMTKTFPSKLPAPPNSMKVNNRLIIGEQQLYGIGIGNGTGNEVEIGATKKELSDRFGIFWKAYPKKKSKGQAEKTFVKVNPDEQLLATMLATIERAKKSDDWLKNSGQYIPHPATWLNAKGWEDEFLEEGGRRGESRSATGGTDTHRRSDGGFTPEEYAASKAAYKARKHL